MPNFLDNPHFGKLVENHPYFAKLVNSYISKVKEGNISIDIKDGKIRFKVQRGSDVQIVDSLSKAEQLNHEILSNRKVYTGRQLGSSVLQPHMGPAHNDLLERLAEEMGGKIEISSYHTNQVSGGYNVVQEAIGGNRGIIIPGDDITYVLKFFKHGEDVALTDEEFFDRMRTHGGGFFMDPTTGPIFKRLKTLLSERSFSMATDKGVENMIQVGLFDPMQLFRLQQAGQIPGAGGADFLAQIKSHPKIYAGVEGLTESGELSPERLQKLAARMVEGTNIIKRSQFDEMISAATGRALELMSTDPDSGRALFRHIDEIKKRVGNGLSFNFRLMGGWDSSLGQVVPFLKGDAIVLENNVFENLAYKLGIGGRDVRTSALGKPVRKFPSVLAARTDVKPEIGFAERSFMTFELHAPGRQSLANLMQMGTFPEYFDEDFARASARFAVEEITAGLETGQIPPKLREAVEAVLDIDQSGMPMEEALELARMKKYAEDILGLVRSGLPLHTTDVALRRFISSYASHLHKYRKGHMGQMLSDGTRDIAGQMPVIGGTRAHIENMELISIAQNKSQSGLELMQSTMRYDQKTNRVVISGPTSMGPSDSITQGLIRYDQSSGRVMVSALDAMQAFRAWGGFDFDDEMNWMVKYDKEQRRLLAVIHRDPSEAGEQMILDVDISNWNFRGVENKTATRLKDLNKKRLEFIDRIDKLSETKNSTGKWAAIAGNTQLLNQVNEEIHGILSDMAETGKIGAISAERIAAAPKGFRLSMGQYKSQNILKSFKRLDPTQARGISKRLARERSLLRRGRNVGSPFVFKGEFYNLFDTGFYNFIANDSAESAAIQTQMKLSSPVDTLATWKSGLQPRPVRQLDIEILEATASLDAAKDSGNAARILAARSKLSQLLIFNSEGALGSYVNVKFTADNFLNTYVRNLRTTEQGRAILETDEFRALRLPILDRERVIDALTKENALEVSQTIDQITEVQARNLVRAVMYINRELEARGIDQSVIARATLSPHLIETRMRRQASVMAGEIMRAGLLPEGLTPESDAIDIVLRAIGGSREKDQISSTEDIYQETADQVLREKDQAITEDIINRMDEVLGDFTPTAQQTKNASRFINEYIENKKAFGQLDELEEITEILKTEQFDGFTGVEEINRRSLQLLQEMGLINVAEDGTFTAAKGLDDQLLAIAQMATAKAGKMKRRTGDILGVLSQTSVTGTSIGDLFRGALLRRTGIHALASEYSGLRKIRQKALAGTLQGYERGSEEYKELVAQIRGLREEIRLLNPNLIGPRGDIAEETIAEMSRITSGRGVLAQPGILGQSRRQMADLASQIVTELREPTTLRRLSTAALKEGREIGGVKGGLVGIAAFTTAGLLYGATHRGRTPEDMQGPPLLPGGSAYETFPELPGNMESIYPSVSRGSMGSGVLYQVDVSGALDPNQFASSIQNITGGSVNTTIYNKRQTTNNGSLTARDILQSLTTGGTY